MGTREGYIEMNNLWTRDWEEYHNDEDAKAADGQCAECGGILDYYGFQKGDRYRAFVACDSCRTAEEF